MVVVQGTLIDLIATSQEDGTEIKLFVKGDQTYIIKDSSFKPYFIILPEGNIQKLVNKIENTTFKSKDKEFRIAEAKIIELMLNNTKTQVIKLFCNTEAEINAVREEVKNWPEVVETSEFAIPLEEKYIIEKGLTPTGGVEVEIENNSVKSVKERKLDIKNLTIGAFDIEVYAKDIMPEMGEAPIIMISYVSNKGTKLVLTTKQINLDYVRAYKTEEDMIKAFADLVKTEDVDILMSYNGDQFDFPFLKKRCKKLGIELSLGRKGENVEIVASANTRKAKVPGRVHLDVYQVIQFLAKIGAINLPTYQLERVYEAILGKHKTEVGHRNIWKAWEEQPEVLAKYNLEDSLAAYELGLEYLDMEVELSRLSGILLNRSSRLSTGSLVENFLIRKAHEKGIFVPRRPKERIVQQRLMNPYQGAYVKEPKPGLYENIVEYDFRSLYPSIIVAHNISPEKLNVPGCKEYSVSPQGYKFCKEGRGFIPVVLKRLIEKRIKVKKQMKAAKDQTEYKKLYAFQWALKILSNSFYGYLGYPRSRWYSRECAEAVTAWARDYIHSTIKKAEEFGFKVIYGDTDGFYAVIPKDKDYAFLEKFLNSINSELPESMELELENTYKRGIFISKRDASGGAKKKYALIDTHGKIKIRGFEIVRRDWSNIAKKTQEAVLKTILVEGDPKKALQVVKDAIKDLENKKVPKEDLIIHTEIKMPLDKYVATGPHVAAALKAQRRGRKIRVGTLIDYIITNNGKTISEKAEEADYVRDGDYDVDYYINNQVIPAALRILYALGYKKEDILQEGTQNKLTKWFG